MSKKIITTSNAPAPIGPYNQAVLAGNTLYISGQIALDTAGNLVMDTLEQEATLVMHNLQAILTEAGTTFANVVKATILLTDMSLFAEVNKIYGSFFTEENAPARETFAVKGLPRGVNVEISMIAVL